MSENLRKQVNSLFLPAYTKDLNLVLCFVFFQTHTSTVGCWFGGFLVVVEFWGVFLCVYVYYQRKNKFKTRF